MYLLGSNRASEMTMMLPRDSLNAAAVSTHSPTTMKRKQAMNLSSMGSPEARPTDPSEGSSSEDRARKERRQTLPATNGQQPPADDGTDCYVENWTFRRPSVEENVRGNKMPWIAVVDAQRFRPPKSQASRGRTGGKGRATGGEADVAAGGGAPSPGSGDGCVDAYHGPFADSILLMDDAEGGLCEFDRSE